jgi:hypothetical protein
LSRCSGLRSKNFVQVSFLSWLASSRGNEYTPSLVMFEGKVGYRIALMPDQSGMSYRGRGSAVLP